MNIEHWGWKIDTSGVWGSWADITDYYWKVFLRQLFPMYLHLPTHFMETSSLQIAISDHVTTF